MTSFSPFEGNHGSKAAANNFDEKLRAVGLNVAGAYVETNARPVGRFWHGNVVLLANRDTVQRLIDDMKPLEG